MTDKRPTEGDALAALERRYSPPFFAFFSHFRDATGFQARRTADGLAMSLYKSRGLAIMGFEVKVSRGDDIDDLLKALSAPASLALWGIKESSKMNGRKLAYAEIARHFREKEGAHRDSVKSPATTAKGAEAFEIMANEYGACAEGLEHKAEAADGLH